MAPSFPASDTSEDEDAAPEAVTLAYSKNIAKGRDVALRNAESELKRKRKEKNRLKDESLKRRAEQTRGNGEYGDSAPTGKKNKNASGKGKERESTSEEGRSLEDRMDRAMREAQDQESDSDEALEAIEEDGSSADEEKSTEDSESSSIDDGELFEDSDSDRMDGVEERQLGNLKARTKTRDRDYLPEHIFAAALSKAQPPSTETASPASRSLKLQPRQKTKRRRPRTAKDVVLGSKTVRMLNSKTTPAVASAAKRTLPPGRVKRFLESQLDLKSKRVEKSRRGWERKAANVGRLRSTGLPATNFARNPVGSV